jgi:hypothetical protein
VLLLLLLLLLLPEEAAAAAACASCTLKFSIQGSWGLMPSCADDTSC